MQRGWFTLVLLLCLAPAALAQLDCPELVTEALDAVSAVCDEVTLRNQACYGHVALTAEPREGVSNFVFEAAGDIAAITDIASIRLQPMDLAEQTWGVALLRLQANLPDTLPGQNVTVVLFGNVTVSDAAPDLPTLAVSTVQDTDALTRPDGTGQVTRVFSAGSALTANGRSEDGLWVRVLVPDDPRQVGWIDAAALEAADLSGLNVVSADTPYYAPMQAFTFHAGVGDAPCEEAPDSGMLVQTPEGAASVTISANGVDITLGSTAFLQFGVAEDGSDFMDVSLIEGRAEIRTDDGSQFVPAGSWSRVTLDENGQAAAAPQTPEPYGPRRIRALPVSLLPRSITIADALTEEQIAQAQQDAAALVLQPGTYTLTPITACNDASETERRGRIAAAGDGFTVETRGGTLTFEPLGAGVFAGSNGSTITLVSSTAFRYQRVLDGCTVTGSGALSD